jgi:hypothetical protein
MYTKSSKPYRKPSLSALRRKNAALKRALSKQRKITALIVANERLANELYESK